MGLLGRFARGGLVAVAGIGIVLAGAPVFAQDAAAPAAPSAGADTAEAPSETKRFDDWTVACGQPKGAPKKFCRAVQVLSNKETGKQVMQILIQYPEGAQEPIAMFVLPLGILVKEGGKFELDNKKIGVLEVQRCIDSGCLAPLILDKEMLDKFKAGSAGNISVTVDKDRVIPLPLSLKGFSAAISELKKG